MTIDASSGIVFPSPFATFNSLTEKLKAEAEEANAQQEVLAKAPLNIFIG